MQFSLLKAAVASIAVMTASSASAVTFDFTGFSSFASKVAETYTSGMVSVTAAPSVPNLVESTSPGATSADPGFYRGIGVLASGTTTGAIDAGEFVNFAIPAGYVISSITVTRTGGAGQFQSFGAFVDGGAVGGGLVTAQNDTATDGRTTFALAPTTGSIFTVLSDGGNDRGIWINALEVDLASAGVVPLPAGIFLLGGALAAGGVASRRKAKKA